MNVSLHKAKSSYLSSLIKGQLRLLGSGSADNFRVVFPPLYASGMLQIPYACEISCLFAWWGFFSEVKFPKEQCGKVRDAINFSEPGKHRVRANGKLCQLRNIRQVENIRAIGSVSWKDEGEAETCRSLSI